MSDFAKDTNVSTNDLISRQAALSTVEKMYKLCEGNLSDYHDLLVACFTDLTPAQQWIPCSEKLPYAECGGSDTVLTTCGYRDVEDTSVRWIRLLYFNGGNWCYPTGETYEAKIYAWMPLPAPYRPEGDEKHEG